MTSIYVCSQWRTNPSTAIHMSDSEHCHSHKTYPRLQSDTMLSIAVRHQTTTAAQSLPLSAVRHQAFNSCQTSNNISCTKRTAVYSETPSRQQLSDIQHCQLHKAYPCLQLDTKPSTAVRHPTTSAAQSLLLSTVRRQSFNSCQTSNIISCTKLTLVCSQTPSLQQLSVCQWTQRSELPPCWQRCSLRVAWDPLTRREEKHWAVSDWSLTLSRVQRATSGQTVPSSSLVLEFNVLLSRKVTSAQNVLGRTLSRFTNDYPSAFLPGMTSTIGRSCHTYLRWWQSAEMTMVTEIMSLMRW